MSLNVYMPMVRPAIPLPWVYAGVFPSAFDAGVGVAVYAHRWFDSDEYEARVLVRVNPYVAGGINCLPEDVERDPTEAEYDAMKRGAQAVSDDEDYQVIEITE